MIFDARVSTYMQEVLLPKVVDNVLGSNVLTTRLIANAKQGRSTSVQKAIKYRESGAFTSFAGLDTFSASPLNTKIKLSYEMAGVRVPMAISGMEEVAAKTAGDRMTTDLAVAVLEESEMELISGLGSVMYGDGTGNSGKDPNGLGNIVDDGTNVDSIGNQSRATYTALKAKMTSLSDGVLSMARLSTLYSDVSSGTDKTTPTLIIGSDSTWDLYESLLAPQVQHTYSETGYYNVTNNRRSVQRGAGMVGNGGFVAVTFKGIPFVKDEKATASTIHMLNEDHIDWYGWDGSGAGGGYTKISFDQTQFESTYGEMPISDFTGFNFSGLQSVPNQFGTIGDLIVLGNLTTWNPRRQGKLTNVLSV